MTIKGTEGQDKIIQSNKSPVLFKCIGLVMLLLVAVALSFTKISDWYSQIISFEENKLLERVLFFVIAFFMVVFFKLKRGLRDSKEDLVN